MTKIIGIGNALTDILVHLPQETLLQTFQLSKGGMFHIDEQQMRAIHAAIAPLSPARATGGSAANTIHALATLGDKVGFVGSVGDDETGRFFATHQQQRGIDARLHVNKRGVIGIATTLITPDGERTFATHLGCSTAIQTTDLCRLVEEYQQEAPNGEGQPSLILHVEGYLVQNHDLIEEALRLAKEAGMTVSYDLASWNIVREDLDFVKHLVKDYVDIAFANEEEAAAFSQQQDPQTALQMLAAQTDIAVVKVGKRGAYAMQGEHVAFAPGLVRKAVDTTAAGDFFAAGFLHGLIHGQTLETCLNYGNHLAGEVIQVLGTQLSDERIRAAIADI